MCCAGVRLMTLTFLAYAHSINDRSGPLMPKNTQKKHFLADTGAEVCFICPHKQMV